MATSPSSPLEDADHGFSRKEMYSSKLVGTVKEYDTHIFACVDSTAENWPKGKIDDFSDTIGDTLKKRKSDITRKIKVTAIESTGLPDASSGDVLIFPEMIRLKGLTTENVEKFVEEAIIGSSYSNFDASPLQKTQVFVCCHSQHDARCGVCGPPLVEEFRKVSKEYNLDIAIWPCSHIGGHKYAGNVIIYHKLDDTHVTGNWYGYVTPKDVPKLIEATNEGKILDHLWRGGLGLSQEAQMEQQLQRLQGFAGCGANCACINNPELDDTSNVLEEPFKPLSVSTKSISTKKNWNQSTVLASTAIAIGVSLIAVAWYIRFRSRD